MQATVKRWFGKFPDMGDVIKRFPAAVLAMAVFTLIVIFENIMPNRSEMGRLLAGLVLAGYLCVSYVLASETRGKKPSFILQLAAVGLIAAIAWASETLRFNLPMAIGAAVLFLGNAVLWRQARDDLHIWDFTHKLWTGALFAVAGSIIFALGILAIQEALRSLFGLNIRDLSEHLLLPIGLGFLAPLYWMATLPPVDEGYSELYENPGFVSKAVAFLGTWLLSPLTLIYALILLAYGVKIVLSGELPKGEIAQLTSPFLIVGTLTWLVLDPPFTNDKALAKLFRKLWWPVSIPAALLLAVAVFVRIREYGYTPERFALTTLIVWALGLAIWFTFAPKEKRDIRLIPGFAAVLLAGGALGAGWLSHLNQGQRFEAGLYASGVVAADGTIADAPVITDMDAARKAKGAFEYLMRHEGRGRVGAILSATSVSFDLEKLDREAVLKTLGLEKVKSAYGSGNRENTYYARDDAAIPITGFDTLRGPFSIYELSSKREIFKGNAISASTKDAVISFNINGEVIDFDAIDWVDQQGLPFGDVQIDTPAIKLLDGDNIALTVLVNNFNRWENTSDAQTENGINMDFYVLTRGIE